eukprot:1159005-Pelagomonas_calceolata.AAC.7
MPSLKSLQSHKGIEQGCASGEEEGGGDCAWGESQGNQTGWCLGRVRRQSNRVVLQEKKRAEGTVLGDIYTFLVWFGYRHLLLQLSCPCRQVQLCNPILSYPWGESQGNQTGWCLRRVRVTGASNWAVLQEKKRVEGIMIEESHKGINRVVLEEKESKEGCPSVGSPTNKMRVASHMCSQKGRAAQR